MHGVDHGRQVTIVRHVTDNSDRLYATRTQPVLKAGAGESRGAGAFPEPHRPAASARSRSQSPAHRKREVTFGRPGQHMSSPRRKKVWQRNWRISPVLMAFQWCLTRL